MIIINKNMLKGKIIEKGFSIAKLAEMVEVDKSTLYRKINEESISVKEANLIVKILNLTQEEAISIFFNQFVA